MINEVFLALIQAATEFLPISSSGHLALFSNIISEPDVFFFTVLQLSSLFAVIIFTRKEIKDLVLFRGNRRLWIYLIISTIPALFFGLIFKRIIEHSFSSLLFLGFAFIFTGIILFFTKFTKPYSEFNSKNSLFIGLFQALALFPGVSRSGMTISSALFAGIDREKAAKFSFLLFIPLSIGAFVLEVGGFYFNTSLLIAFLISLVFSLIFLKLLLEVIKKNALWIFSIYCLFIGLTSLFLHFRG